MVPTMYWLSLGYMPTLLLCSTLLQLGICKVRFPTSWTIGFLPIGGTGRDQQVTGREKMLCLFSFILFPLPSSDNDSGRIFRPSSTTLLGVAGPPAFSSLMAPRPPPFCAPRHRGGSYFLKLLISGLHLTFLIFCLPTHFPYWISSLWNTSCGFGFRSWYSDLSKIGINRLLSLFPSRINEGKLGKANLKMDWHLIVSAH